jgi:hypothetical protein
VIGREGKNVSKVVCYMLIIVVTVSIIDYLIDCLVADDAVRPEQSETKRNETKPNSRIIYRYLGGVSSALSNLSIIFVFSLCIGIAWTGWNVYPLGLRMGFLGGS